MGQQQIDACQKLIDDTEQSIADLRELRPAHEGQWVLATPDATMFFKDGADKLTGLRDAKAYPEAIRLTVHNGAGERLIWWEWTEAVDAVIASQKRMADGLRNVLAKLERGEAVSVEDMGY